MPAAGKIGVWFAICAWPGYVGVCCIITIDPSSTRLLARALLDVKYEATLLARGGEMIGVEGKAGEYEGYDV